MPGLKPKKARILRLAAVLAGALLGLIGVRYLLEPESAAQTFGVPGRPVGHELYYIIGLRNLWLAALAIGLAALRQWHGLALWFGTGVVVCFADALIAANSTAEVPQVAFHLVCGLLCALLAAVAWRGASRGGRGGRNFAALDPSWSRSKDGRQAPNQPL